MLAQENSLFDSLDGRCYTRRPSFRWSWALFAFSVGVATVDDAMEDYKKAIAGTFDAVASGYDSANLRFFPNCAKHMVSLLGLRGDESALDVACGTGHATLALATGLPRGHVTGVDFSPGMLDQARAKLKAADLTCEVELLQGDMQALPWCQRFDVATCAFGIFFVADMPGTLAHIASTLKPRGKIVLSCFAVNYMEPLRSMLVERLEKSYGVPPTPPLWKVIGNEEGCLKLFADAGLGDVHVEKRQMGYFLPDAEAWWQVIWNAGFRRMLAGLAPDALARFRDEHLREIGALRTDEGIWMDVSVLFTSGRASDAVIE
jgi:ubiquinone/menaquinone biosynthesis C-methylase UbiE